jgi:hypothetical protein
MSTGRRKVEDAMSLLRQAEWAYEQVRRTGDRNTEVQACLARTLARIRNISTLAQPQVEIDRMGVIASLEVVAERPEVVNAKLTFRTDIIWIILTVVIMVLITAKHLFC